MRVILKEIPPPPTFTENEIIAIYWDMRNKGQFYIPQLGSHPIGIDEWRKRELDKLNTRSPNDQR